MDGFLIICGNQYIALDSMSISNGDNVFQHAKLLLHISVYNIYPLGQGKLTSLSPNAVFINQVLS